MQSKTSQRIVLWCTLIRCKASFNIVLHLTRNNLTCHSFCYNHSVMTFLMIYNYEQIIICHKGCTVHHKLIIHFKLPMITSIMIYEHWLHRECCQPHICLIFNISFMLTSQSRCLGTKSWSFFWSHKAQFLRAHVVCHHSWSTRCRFLVGDVGRE